MTYSVTVQEFMALATKESVNVLDLRDPDFFDPFDFPEKANVIPIPLTQLPNYFHQLDRGKTYYLFTQSGDHSKTMVHFLQKHELQVVHVIGGTFAYQQYLAS